MSNLVGQQISHYQIKALLGQGRIGAVYQAINLEDQSPVALKVVSLHLTQQPEFRRRFLEEVQTIPRLDHPSIVKVHEAGIDTEQDILYLTMEYVVERSLTAYLQQLQWRGEVIRPGEALLIGAQVAEALGYAHQKGVIHRDIRPNVILFRLDEDAREIGGVPRRAVVSDFTLLTMLEAETEPFKLSLPYMSPEQCLKKEMDGRSDLYSLGILLYQIITGQLPFAIATLDDAVRYHSYEDPPSPRQIRPDLPPTVESVLLKSLSKNPANRFQTGAEMAEALRQMAAALPATLAMPTPEEEVESVQTQSESSELLAIQASQWATDVDRVTITQEVPHSLNRRIITVGRSQTNDIVLAAASVTRQHAQLERTSTGWQIRDLGSQNSTFLDGHPLLPDIPEEWLSHQTLRIGPYFLQLQLGKGYDYKAHPFSVELMPDEIDITPGKQKQLQVTVVNEGTAVDDFEIAVERLPSSWVTVPAAPLHLRPGEAKTATVTVHPPLVKNITLGRTRFLLVVNPTSNGQEQISKPGVVDVKSAQDAFSIEMDPTEIQGKGISHLLIRNEGVADATYTIIGRSPDEAIRFGEWRLREEVTAERTQSAVATGSKRPSSSLSRSPFLNRLSFVRRLRTAPRMAMGRAASVPRQALNRMLPGLGSALRMDGLGKQTGKASKPKAPAAKPQITPFAGRKGKVDKVTFPGELHTQVEIAAAQQAEVYLSVAPRKRPFLKQHNQSLSFKVLVSTPTSKRQTIDGQLDVKPRIRVRRSLVIIPILLLFICSLSAFLISTYNETLSTIISTSADIDNDGITNIAEVYIHRTDPNRADTDGDGLADGLELEAGLDPNKTDTDGDALSDKMEVELGTNPLAFDTDGDTLSDGLEIQTLHTDPLIADTSPILPLPSPTATPMPTSTPIPIPTTSPAPTPSSVQTTLSGRPSEDGYIIQEGSAGSLAINNDERIQVGDGINENRQYKGILSFDTSTLPDNAIIQSVQLRLRQSDSTGTPTSLGQLHVDIAPENGFDNNPSLETGDFAANAAIVNATTLSQAAGDNEWVEGFLSQTGFNVINRQGVTQFRIYFTLPNNSNGTEDWLGFYSADHATETWRPQLIVVYETP